VGPTGEHNQISLHGRGVIACISPWNFPLAIFLGQITAALAAGNCVVAKPASQTACIASLAIACFHEAGFPKAVVQLLVGKGNVVGSLLIQDKRIKGVMFTGSTETARGINQVLAQREGAIVPLVAETGGQNAMIVDSTALPEQVVKDVITSSFTSAGQRCSALRVLFLQEEIAQKILKMLVGAMAEIRVGNPMALSTDVGPLIDDVQRQSLLEHKNWLQQNGKILFEVPLDPTCQNGFFFAPILAEIDNIGQLQKEIFGPILHVIRFKAQVLDSVISSINETGYGLTLGIHTRIEEKAAYIHQRAKVGNTYVNRNMIGAVVGVQPFGGEGLSGTGPKAGGPNYLLRLATERTLSIDTTASGGNTSLMVLGV